MISAAVAVMSVVTIAMSKSLLVVVLRWLSLTRMTRTGSVRQTPNQRPVISVVRTVMVVPYRLIRVSDQVLLSVALRAMSVGVPMRSPRSRGRPRFPLAAGVGWWNTALRRALVVRVMLGPRPAKCRAPAERQGDDDRQDDPAVAVADFLGAGGGSVVPPGRGEDFRSASSGEGFIDGEQDRVVGCEQQVDDQGGQDQADLVDVPAGAGEEPVGAGMVPHPGQARGGQHSAYCSFHRAEDESGEHRGEHLVSRCGETGPETVQQRQQGIGYTDLGGHWWNTPFIGGVVSTTNVPPHSRKSSEARRRNGVQFKVLNLAFRFLIQ